MFVIVESFSLGVEHKPRALAKHRSKTLQRNGDLFSGPLSIMNVSKIYPDCILSFDGLFKTSLFLRHNEAY